MSEMKEYWDEALDAGNIKIANDVVATIAALAVMETKGVHGLSSGFGADIAEFLGKKSSSKGIKLRFANENTVEIDVFVLVKYGSIISEVAKEIQKSVASAIESMTGLKLAAVNVNVTGIVFEEAAAADKQ